jgi:hypothetical protein
VVRRLTGLVGELSAVASLLPDHSAAGVGEVCVLAKPLPKLRRAALALAAPTSPMRSGMTKNANAENEAAPKVNATQGVQRHINTLGSPYSRIRTES